MYHLTTSEDSSLSFEAVFDWHTSELVVISREPGALGVELARFSMPQLLLEYARLVGQPNILDSRAIVNLSHGEVARMLDLEHRRIARFRRNSHILIRGC